MLLLFETAIDYLARESIGLCDFDRFSTYILCNNFVVVLAKVDVVSTP